VQLRDIPEEDAKAHFDDLADWIHDRITDKKSSVLVHW
jgi:hypothetical protein